MDRREFVSRAVAAGIVGTASCCTGGCGTMIHSERVGRPHSRDLDWKMVGLDALGLVFFFVPGVVAFVVDFCTGAIYLPPECCEDCQSHPTRTAASRAAAGRDRADAGARRPPRRPNAAPRRTALIAISAGPTDFRRIPPIDRSEVEVGPAVDRTCSESPDRARRNVDESHGTCQPAIAARPVQRAAPSARRRSRFWPLAKTVLRAVTHRGRESASPKRFTRALTGCRCRLPTPLAHDTRTSDPRSSEWHPLGSPRRVESTPSLALRACVRIPRLRFGLMLNAPDVLTPA